MVQQVNPKPEEMRDAELSTRLSKQCASAALGSASMFSMVLDTSLGRTAMETLMCQLTIASPLPAS